MAKSTSASAVATKSEPTVRIEVITPAKARQYLTGNTDNFRKLSDTRARALAEVMKRGEFKFNGEKIHIRANGTIGDGQTRLKACVLADTPFKTVVVHGDVEDERNVDTGSKRTTGQIMNHFGVPNANSSAAAIKAYVSIFERETMTHLSHTTPLATSEIIEWLNKHPQMANSVRLAANAPMGMFQAIVAAVHYAGMGLDPKHTEWWMNALTTGENLGENDPVLRLRQRFITAGRRAKLSRTEQAALIIKSWNLSKEGKVVRAVQWRGSGPNPEAFPKLGAFTEATASEQLLADDTGIGFKPKPKGDDGAATVN